MIVFGVIAWLCSGILIFLSVSLLKGNYSNLYGKAFERAEDKAGYARAMGKPVLLMGIGTAVTGILGITVQGSWSVLVSLAFLLMVVGVAILWMVQLEKRF